MESCQNWKGQTDATRTRWKRKRNTHYTKSDTICSLCFPSSRITWLEPLPHPVTSSRMAQRPWCCQWCCLDARPLSLFLFLSFHSPIPEGLHVCFCAGHTRSECVTQPGLGQAPMAWFSEAALTGPFVSVLKLKIKAEGRARASISDRLHGCLGIMDFLTQLLTHMDTQVCAYTHANTNLFL